MPNDVFIKKIHIKKVRHLHDIDIVLDEHERKHLLLTGKNGSGKTSLLDALKKRLSWLENKNRFNYLINIDQETEANNQHINELEEEYRLTKDASQKDELMNFIGSVFSENDTLKLWHNQYNGSCQLDMNSLEVSTLFSKKKFILAFFSAKRAISLALPSGPQRLDLKHKGLSTQVSQNFMQFLVNLRTEKSYANDDGDTETVKHISAWFHRFERYLKKIFNDQSLKLVFDRKNFTFHFKTDKNEHFGFNELSDGYSAVLNIVVDLILRMEASDCKHYDMQGIVLIDELETHLHIDLQKKILPFLCEFFPKLQFIVTTHSPFVLNSVSNAVIYDLERQIRAEDLSAYAYDGLVEGYFENDKYSAQAKQELERYKTLVKQKQLSETEEDEMIDLRLKLRKIPAELATELVTAFQMIELERKAAQQ